MSPRKRYIIESRVAKKRDLMTLCFDIEDGGEPGAQECRQPLETRKGKGWILLQSLQKDHSLANTFILVQ